MNVSLDIHGIIDFKAQDEKKYFTPEMLNKFINDNAEMTVLDIDVDSIGGNVDAGKEIYNTLQGLKSAGVVVNTKSSGDVMSIATIIYLVGEKREADLKLFKGLIHLPFINGSDLKGISLNSESIIELADVIKDIENDICSIYSEKTGKKKDYFFDIMKEEKVMTANEFKEMGIVTDIVDAEKKVVENKSKITAYAYCDEIFNKLNNKADMTNVEIKNELSGLRQMFSDFSSLFKKGIQNMKKADVTGVEVDFGTAQNEAEIVEGLEGVTVDGKPATGEYIFSDFKVTVENGKVTKRETVEEAGSEEMENLKKENDDLKKEIEDLKAGKTEIENSFSNFKADAENKFKEYFDKFEAFQNKFPDAVIQNLAGSPIGTSGNEDVPLFVKKQK